MTTTIIGIMATAGLVSYESAKTSSRDAKRVSDVKQIQTALELYFEYYSHYPGDNIPGANGEILGEPETKYLTDRGFQPIQAGTLFLIVPKNPPPNGTPYVYRSIDRTGRDCDLAACDAYAILFTLEKEQGSWLAGPHALTPTGIAGAEGGEAGLGLAGRQPLTGLEGARATATAYMDTVTTGVGDLLADENVQTVTEIAVAPAAVGIAAANTAAATLPIGAAGLQYLLSFLVQPFALLSRRRYKNWGTVYNSLSKMPEDLVIVRLRDAVTGKILKSAVTDARGTFSFLVRRGHYRLEAVKVGFVFPSASLAGLPTDGPYGNLYFGAAVEADTDGLLLTPNIPLDPTEREASDTVVMRRKRWRGLQRTLAVVGPLLGGISMVISPTLPVVLMFAFQVVVLMFFRRLAFTPEPKTWGTVYDEATKRAVPKAVVRIFESRFNKLLETQVTDAQGRYHFRVGANKYYLTVNKPGYLKTETDPLDLTAAKEPTVIASDLPLRRSDETTKRVDVFVASKFEPGREPGGAVTVVEQTVPTAPAPAKTPPPAKEVPALPEELAAPAPAIKPAATPPSPEPPASAPEPAATPEPRVELASPPPAKTDLPPIPSEPGEGITSKPPETGNYF